MECRVKHCPAELLLEVSSSGLLRAVTSSGQVLSGTSASRESLEMVPKTTKTLVLGG